MSRDVVPFAHPWDEALLGEVAHVVVGGTPSTSIPSFWGGEIPWMASGDVHLRHVHQVSGRITEQGLRFSNAVLVEPNAVAMALAGQGKTRGTVALTHIPLCTNQSVALIKPSDQKLDPVFLYQSLIPRYEEMRSRSSGGGRAGLTKAIIEKTPIQLPSPPQQRKIARILTTVDNLIEKTEALISKYQAMKQGMMHDLFTRGVDEHGHLRPPYEEAPELYKESELGWVPKEWKAQRLGEALRASGGFLQTGPFGSQLHSYEYVSEGVPVVMPQDITGGRIFTTEIARIPQSKADAMARHKLRSNDIVFSRRGDLSRAASISANEDGWICGTGCFLLRCSPNQLNANWLARQYTMPHVQRQVDANAVGSTMPSLNNTVMERLLLLIPPPSEQTEIGKRITVLESIYENLNSQLHKFSLTKSGLMQDLLTGKVRVKVDETEEVASV